MQSATLLADLSFMQSLLVLEASCLQELVVDKVAKLLIDASRAFFGLSSASLSLGLFGRALRYIGHSLTCLLAARPHCDNLCVEELLASAWKLCGNVHMLLAKVCVCMCVHVCVCVCVCVCVFLCASTKPIVYVSGLLYVWTLNVNVH